MDQVRLARLGVRLEAPPRDHVAGVWIPLAAELTPANVADNEPAPRLLDELPFEVGVVPVDTRYNDPAVRDHCASTGRLLVATRRGRYPHTDPGVEVRRLFHRLRTHAIENFNGQFKGIFDAHGPVPTRGLALHYRFEHRQDVRVDLKGFLKAA